jgi:flagellar biosynthesis protein FliR
VDSDKALCLDWQLLEKQHVTTTPVVCRLQSFLNLISIFSRRNVPKPSSSVKELKNEIKL